MGKEQRRPRLLALQWDDVQKDLKLTFISFSINILLH